MPTKFLILVILQVAICGQAFAQYTQPQLGRWLKQYPQADTNKDGKLTSAEANAYIKKMRRGNAKVGAPTEFKVNPGWDQPRFPEKAVCYKTPKEIAELYASVSRDTDGVTSYPKPSDGSLRIVATGHSFMAPGFKTFPPIAKAAGFGQTSMFTHTGGGMTGSARYKWEQENGIFQFDGKPTPKLLASIANAKWDAMLWGPYFHDRPAYYLCWIEFCLKYNPDMKFYLSDAWPQLDQLDPIPSSEAGLTTEVIQKMGDDKHELNQQLIGELNAKYPGKVFVLPTSHAMVLAAKYYHQGDLPGIEGIHTYLGKKNRSLWRDRLGHLGPGFERLEGYVFYATLYGRSPELIQKEIKMSQQNGFPSDELDRVFRKIAWQAVLANPLAGVADKNENGIDDKREAASENQPSENQPAEIAK